MLQSKPNDHDDALAASTDTNFVSVLSRVVGQGAGRGKQG